MAWYSILRHVVLGRAMHAARHTLYALRDMHDTIRKSSAVHCELHPHTPKPQSIRKLGGSPRADSHVQGATLRQTKGK